MNRKRLKELAEDDRFIPGIYNYCDRWCERCPQTARCMNFALDQEEDAEPEERDVRNEAFWNKLSGIFRETIEMLEEMANEHGVDLKTLDTEEIQEEIAAKRDAAANHVLSRAARGYAKLADDWFKEKGELFFFPDVGPQSENVTVDEALEVIRWYQYFIAAKV
ncbi:MAG TPA: hypothetical protein VLS90_09920, partial [Thermodesulfobacteriota bacterium]|nr:hypothetical protein [Thermodesulfobacteriota bacterium]